MKSKALVLSSIAAAAAIGLILGYALLKPGRNAEQPGPVAAGAQADAAYTNAPAPEPAELPPAATNTAAMPPERVDELIARGFIPAEYRELWLDPNYQTIAEERFNVIPNISAEGREACVQLMIDGRILCWNEYGYHPYLTYEVDQLREMASTDAAAAEALVILLPISNRQERMQYALEASRLSGKSGPIMRFAYSFSPDRTSPRYFDEMLDRYAIAVAGESLGYPYRLSRELEIAIRREFDLSDEEFRDALRGRRVTMQEAWGDPS